MSFFGAVRLLVTAWERRPLPAAGDEMREIEPGAFAAWTRSAPAAVVPRNLGDACRTSAGGAGILVEIVERGRPLRFCQEV